MDQMIRIGMEQKADKDLTSWWQAAHRHSPGALILHNMLVRS
jgi:hypothetical protein